VFSINIYTQLYSYTYNTYIHTHIHTYIYTHIHTYIHTYIHDTYIHTWYIHTYIHTCIQTDMQVYTSMHTYTHIHAYIQTDIHTSIHTHKYTYIHTDIQTSKSMYMFSCYNLQLRNILTPIYIIYWQFHLLNVESNHFTLRERFLLLSMLFQYITVTCTLHIVVRILDHRYIKISLEHDWIDVLKSYMQTFPYTTHVLRSAVPPPSCERTSYNVGHTPTKTWCIL